MSWNWRNRKSRLLLGVALVACMLALVRPLIAHAGYPLATQGRVALGFGASYTSAEATSSATHHGTDIAAETGARILAPFAGTVTFSGRVPAVGGGTVRAVTISTSSGTVTLLPLASSLVTKGDVLAEGDAVGTLAGDGDGSSSGTHLHVGVKRGDLYVDPMSLLTLPAVAPESPGGSGAGAGAEAAQGSASSAAAASAAHAAASGQPASATGASGAHAAVRSPAGAGAAAGASAPSAVLRPAVPGARLAAGVSIGGVAPATAPGIGAAAAQRALAPLRAVSGVPARAQAEAQVAGTALGAMVARLRAATGQAVRLAALLLAAVLGGIGLLWPLWRKGSSEEGVSAVCDDVAAAVGR